MGSRLGLIIAKIFIDDFETKHMDELTKLGNKNWLRYVDDTFVLIKNQDQADRILEFLNEKRQTIKFTMEKEKKNSISFLYVKINRNIKDNLISNSTYSLDYNRIYYKDFYCI